MSREEEIAKIDEELEKLGVESDEDEGEEVELEETEEEDEPEAKEEKEEPKVEAEAKPEVKLEIKDLPDSTLGYKLREEARKREAAERELAELKKPKISKEENYEGYVDNEISATKQELAELKAWKQEQEQQRNMEAQREGAFRELRGYETEASEAFPDFQDASNYAKSMIAASIKLLEPGLSQDELAQRTIYKYAEHAALALNSKKHPGQAIYEMAHQWGYKKQEAAPEQDVTRTNERPKIVPMSKLAENKKKSSGMSGTGGNGKAFVNMDAVSSMTNAERMKLTESDWARLEAEG